MSKFIMFGMPLSQIIAAATTNAARVFPSFDDRGTLNAGAPADVAIMELREGTFEFLDNYKGTRVGRQRLFPIATVLGGKSVPRTIGRLRHDSICCCVAGQAHVNTDPLPGSLSTKTSPPIIRASLRVMARPRPVPPKRCAIEAYDKSHPPIGEASSMRTPRPAWVKVGQCRAEALFKKQQQRSEEHTSELKSLRHLVCRLL